MVLATVTVMFTDVVDSTATAERLGPAGAERARRAHFEALRGALAANRGNEIKNAGDGLMIVFDSPSDAVACASAMQAAVQRAASGSDAAIRMRIGIGLGEASHEEDDWFGMPVVRAARLCGVAAPEQVLVDRFVASLAVSAGATFRPLEPVELKGIADPEPVFELVPASRRAVLPLPAAIAQPDASVFVGRAGHLARLRDARTRVEERGTTSLVLLAGEPGAGKTSIAAEFARATHRDDVPVLFGRCDDGPGLAYQPFAQALGHLVRHVDDAILASHVREFGGELARLLPQVTAQVPDVPPAIVGDPAGEQWRLFTAVDGLLREVTRAGPMVLVIDDLHWAASPTLQLLTYLLRSDEPVPLLVVATYRDTEVGRAQPLADALAELRRLPTVERIGVGGLDADETAQLLTAVAGHELDSDGRSLADSLHARTEGNPFFAVEVLRHLAESDVILFDEGRWRAAGDIDAATLPEGVKEVVGRRLRGLSDEANRALAAGAVVGLDFDAVVVARVMDIDLVDLLEALSDVVRAGLVDEGLRPNMFSFTHALIRGTVREELGAARRVQLHGRVAEAIEHLYGDDLEPWLATLAYHCAEAAYPGRTAPAVDYALRAAAQSRRSAAVDLGIAQLERGLEAARIGDPPDPSEVATILIALADATAVDDPTRARAFATEASGVAADAGLPVLVAAAAATMWSVVETTNAGSVRGDRWLLDLCGRALEHEQLLEPAIRSRLVAMDALLRRWTDDDVDAKRVAAALDEAVEADDAASMAIGVVAAWSVQTDADTLRLEVPRYRAVFDHIVETSDDHHLRGMVAVFSCWGASAAGDSAWYDEGLAGVNRAYELLHSPRMRAWVEWLRALKALRLGDWDEAIAATTAAQEASVDPIIASAMWGLHTSLALANQGRADEVLPFLGEASGLNQDGPPLAMSALYHALSGDAATAASRLATIVEHGYLQRDPSGVAWLGYAGWAAAIVGDEEAVRYVQPVLRPYSGTIAAGGICEAGAVDRFLGMCAAVQGRHDEADELYRRALELEERFGATALAVHTGYWWARSLLARGAGDDRERADALLRSCIATAERLGMAQVVREARDLQPAR